MKYYKFAVKNWKSDCNCPFWFYKKFPSAYHADRYATRLTYQVKNCPYMVICSFGEEKPA